MAFVSSAPDTHYEIRYTLCFLTRGDDVLMLHRAKSPNKGLWNGVGGKIHQDESPLAACLREVKEETGFSLQSANFAGVLTWSGFEVSDGGLYIFVAPAPDGDPVESGEGRLAWKPRAWVFSSHDVVDNIHHFAPRVLNGDPPGHYHFEYRDKVMTHWEIKTLPSDFDSRNF